MSAAEVIVEIEKLPPEEQAKVFAFVVEEQKRQITGSAHVKYVDAETFEAAKGLVLKENAELLRRLAQ